MQKEENGVLTLSAHEKMEIVPNAFITRKWRDENDEPINSIYKKLFNSINGSIDFLGQNFSLLFSFYNSFLQQRRSSPKVKDIIKQKYVVRKL